MKNESLTEFPWGVFANSITAEKAKHVCQNFGMEITGLVVTKTKIDGEAADAGLTAIVDKGAVRWLKKDETWDLMHGVFISGGKMESLTVGDDVIILITVPRTQLLTELYCATLKQSLAELFPAGQRIFIKNEDMNMDVLHHLLTAEDLANLSARLEQKNQRAAGPDQQKQT